MNKLEVGTVYYIITENRSIIKCLIAKFIRSMCPIDKTIKEFYYDIDDFIIESDALIYANYREAVFALIDILMRDLDD